MKALLRLYYGLYEGSTKALLRLYEGSTKALLKLYEGSTKALLKLYEGSTKASYLGSIKARDLEQAGPSACQHLAGRGLMQMRLRLLPPMQAPFVLRLARAAARAVGCIRHHTSAYVSIRQHASAYVREP